MKIETYFLKYIIRFPDCKDGKLESHRFLRIEQEKLVSVCAKRHGLAPPVRRAPERRKIPARRESSGAGKEFRGKRRGTVFRPAAESLMRETYFFSYSFLTLSVRNG